MGPAIRGRGDILMCMAQADECAMLASAPLQLLYKRIPTLSGAQRSRLLSTLYKDERSPELPVFALLEKVRDAKGGYRPPTETMY